MIYFTCIIQKKCFKKQENKRKEKKSLFNEKKKMWHKEKDQLVKNIKQVQMGRLPWWAELQKGSKQKTKKLKTRAQKLMKFVKMLGLDLHFWS